MKVLVIDEYGFEYALWGLGLSYNQVPERSVERIASIEYSNILNRLQIIADKLYNKDTGENKFLESISVWLDITAPRYWWQQFDTYRSGVSKQSSSTMHTLMKRELTQEDFESFIDPVILNLLNTYIKEGDFAKAKNILPEGFLQRRVVTTNYKTLRHIYHQRVSHRLKEWTTFCSAIKEQTLYPKYITGEEDGR